MYKKETKTVTLVQLALFGAIIFIMAFTPFVGYIPLGFTKATIIHVPVIIASIILGPKKGAFLGFLFGLTSLINNTINPTLTSFVFSPFYTAGEVNGGFLSLVICFVPRILVGVVPYYVSELFSKFRLSKSLGYAAAGLCGSLTNTVLVMNMIYLFFGKSYCAARGVATGAARGVATGAAALYRVILSVICINGIPEAIIAAILTAVIVKAVGAARKSKK